MWIPGRENDIPVGVLEADASLLEFVCVLQLGDLLGVDGRFGHGLLGEGGQVMRALISPRNS